MKAMSPKQALGRLVPRLVWATVVATAVAGAVVGLGASVGANRPPQEAAAMALAYLVVIVPYAFVVRSVDDLMH
jgi:hypothetical protein